MGILLEDIFQLFGDHISLDVYDYENDELLDTYDGKNSVREVFNDCEVKRLVPNWRQQVIEVYLEV